MVISYSSIIVFSMVLYTDGMVQLVQYNYPGVVNMVQLFQMLLYETVTICSMDLLESENILFKCTGWLFVIEF